MATRSYGQHCGLAASLDLVGQRWSMLIIRDLAPGPRRFNELFRGLPGIATDVLAERLRELEEAGVVVHRAAPASGGANVYALTPSGVALSAIVAQLADWGRRLLPPVPADGMKVNARWALQTVTQGYLGGLADGDYDLVVDGDELHVRVSGDVAALRYGRSAGVARVRISCSTEQLLSAMRRPGRAERLPRGLHVDGDADTATAFLRAFPLRVGSAASTDH